MSFPVPIVLCIFNRPEVTSQVFDTVRRVAPEKLFVIADGPRPSRPEDASMCSAARGVVSVVDWPCTVMRNYSEVNLGDGHRIASGLDWVFDQVEEAIVLEDDVLPDLSFFGYCEELLARYRDHPEVMMISGYNALGRWPGTDGDSYLFSRYSSIWGWATWRRVWQLYDFSLDRYRSSDVESAFREYLADEEQAEHLAWLFRDVVRRPVNKWDVQLQMIGLLHGGVCAVPRINLIRNLGFGASATHTQNEKDPRDLPHFSLGLRVVHPRRAPVECIDPLYGRWSYWMQLLAKYDDLRFLGMWGRALKNNPELEFPQNGSSAFYGTPLRYPEEALKMLEHVSQFMPDRARLGRLIELFASVSGGGGT